MQNFDFTGTMTVRGTLSGRVFFKGVSDVVMNISEINAGVDLTYGRGGVETGIAFGPNSQITVGTFTAGHIGYGSFLDRTWYDPYQPSQGNWPPFEGDVTVTGNMGSAAQISTTQCNPSVDDFAVDLGAHIVVQGNMAGTIASTGNIGLADSDAKIEIDGNLSGTIATVNADDAHRGDILHDIVIGGSVTETGEVESIGDLAANIQIAGDLAGTIATVPGSEPAKGDILQNIVIGVDLAVTGQIHALRDLLGEIQIYGSLLANPSIDYEVWIDHAMGADAAVVVNWDTLLIEGPPWHFVDIWETGAMVKIGTEPQDPEYTGNDKDHRIFLITCQKGDLDNSGTTNNFDITPFMHALQGPAVYDQAHCGLVGSMDYHADMNCDGLVNNFDITPFIQKITDPGQYEVDHPGCEKCATGDEALRSEGSCDPAAVAALLEESVDAELMPFLISVGEDIVANSPDDAEAAFWAAVLAELE
jgi:hypothetical protein